MERKASNICLILARAAITLLFLSCVLFIWHNSMESAEVSSGRSGRITEAVNEFLAQNPGGSLF